MTTRKKMARVGRLHVVGDRRAAAPTCASDQKWARARCANDDDYDRWLRSRHFDITIAYAHADGRAQVRIVTASRRARAQLKEDEARASAQRARLFCYQTLADCCDRDADDDDNGDDARRLRRRHAAAATATSSAALERLKSNTNERAISAEEAART